MDRLKTFENFENNLDDLNDSDTIISTEILTGTKTGSSSKWNYTIPIGTEGVIMMDYGHYPWEDADNRKFLVKFYDEDHNTLSVETVTKKQIKKYENI